MGGAERQGRKPLLAAETPRDSATITSPPSGTTTGDTDGGGIKTPHIPSVVAGATKKGGATGPATGTSPTSHAQKQDDRSASVTALSQFSVNLSVRKEATLQNVVPVKCMAKH